MWAVPKTINVVFVVFFVAQDLICSYVRKALTDNEVDYVGT